MAEKSLLQELILKLLDKDSIISNTGSLELDGKPINQLEALGVLNALKSREVSLDRMLICR